MRTIDCEENESFLRKLNYVQDEANALKIGLSEFLREITSKENLVEVENLHTRLIRLDEFISTIRYYRMISGKTFVRGVLIQLVWKAESG